MDTLGDNQKIIGLADVVQQIAAGNFSVRAGVSDRGDEFDALCTGINMLAEEIERREKDIKSKVEQLQKINDVFVDRELRMTELKKEVDQLRRQVEELQNRLGPAVAS